MTKHKPNPYKGMEVDKLREVINAKGYSGMTIKELACEDDRLAYMLKRKKEGIIPLNVFSEEGSIKRMNRPKNYFSKLSPKKAIEMVREKYQGLTPNQLSDADASFLYYLEKTRIRGRTLMEVLLEEGTLIHGSKSHPKREGERYPKWETLTAGYRSFREYMPHYMKGARH